MAGQQRNRPQVSIEFGEEEWREDVERYQPSAIPRARAQSARREIEAGTAQLDWKRCRPEGHHDARLPHCLKLYVPLAQQGASNAPYGFVFELQRKADNSPMLSFPRLRRAPPRQPCDAHGLRTRPQAPARPLSLGGLTDLAETPAHRVDQVVRSNPARPMPWLPQPRPELIVKPGEDRAPSADARPS